MVDERPLKKGFFKGQVFVLGAENVVLNECMPEFLIGGKVYEMESDQLLTAIHVVDQDSICVKFGVTLVDNENVRAVIVAVLSVFVGLVPPLMVSIDSLIGVFIVPLDPDRIVFTVVCTINIHLNTKAVLVDHIRFISFDSVVGFSTVQV